MSTLLEATQTEPSVFQTFHERIDLDTTTCLQFIDITDRVQDHVARSGVKFGVVNIHTQHTTAAILINECEPLLLDDLRNTLERLAPRGGDYAHDDFTIRTVNLLPGEKPNGHAHCKALFLRSSESVNIVNGEMQFGPWQRIFFVELDCARERTISVLVMGLTVRRSGAVRARPRHAREERVL